ncbi:DUF1080 domain-containing protein [Candidatus Poribacteria bacterium]|nr:DUF1080 domain-containing protein [Candidatus Poribacteria bacterium]
MKHIMVMLILTLLVSSTWAGMFRDDFNDRDLKGWTFVQDAEDGGIQKDELVLGSRKSTVIIAVDGVVARDYEVAVSVKIRKLVSGPIANGLLIGLRAQALRENENHPLDQYDLAYNFLIGRNADKTKGLGAAIWHVGDLLPRRRGGQRVLIVQKVLKFSPFNVQLDTWYRLKVIAKGNRFQVFVDEEKMLDFLDNTYTEGRIYLSGGGGNIAHFNDFEAQWDDLAVQDRRKLTTTWGQIKRSVR